MLAARPQGDHPDAHHYHQHENSHPSYLPKDSPVSSSHFPNLHKPTTARRPNDLSPDLPGLHPGSATIPRFRDAEGTHAETPRHGGKARGIMTEAMPVGLCSVTAPSRSAARGAPVKGDGIVCSVSGSRLGRLDPLHPRGPDGDATECVPTGVGAPAPSDAAHCITHPRMPSASLRRHHRPAPGVSEPSALSSQLSTLQSSFLRVAEGMSFVQAVL